MPDYVILPGFRFTGRHSHFPLLLRHAWRVVFEGSPVPMVPLEGKKCCFTFLPQWLNWSLASGLGIHIPHCGWCGLGDYKYCNHHDRPSPMRAAIIFNFDHFSGSLLALGWSSTTTSRRPPCRRALVTYPCSFCFGPRNGLVAETALTTKPSKM